MSLISVIIPVYNLEDYIEKTVRSVCAQTYNNLEIILVDDGSADNSLSILHRLETEDSRIRVIHQENAGVTAARMAGIRSASGQWIGFVDGDDFVEPEMYERLMGNALTYNADISHCGYQMVFPGRVDFYYNTKKLALQDCSTGLKDLLEGSFIEPCLGTKLYRKELFQRLMTECLMDTDIKNMEDLLMNYYLFREAKKSVYEDICPYHYVLRKASAATAAWNKHKLEDPQRVFDILLRETENNSELNATVKSRQLAQLIRTATLEYGNQKELIQPYRRAARKKLRQELLEVRKSGLGKRTEIMAVWAGFFPDTYCVVHRIYARIRGTDKKYEVE